MPPRNESLPEGTDQIIDGAAETGNSGGGGGGGTGGGGRGGKRSGGGSGFVASGGGTDTGTAGGGGGGAGSGASEGLSADRIIAQVRDQVASLRDQATGRAREVAEGGKDRTTSLLDDLAGVFEETARAIDERLGDQYGDYAHRAGDAISSLAGSLREKTVEDLIEDTRSVVRKSPAVTVGTAALLGFLLVRLVKTGLDDVGLTGRGKSGKGGGKDGGGSSGSGD